MKEIKLTRGQVTLVDDDKCDYLMQWKWRAHSCKKRWYAVRNRRKSEKPGSHIIYMHRVLLRIEGTKIYGDHKDRNSLNNQCSNLREATSSQNHMNQSAETKNKSGFKGVYFLKKSLRKPYLASIRINKKTHYIGLYATGIEAAIAYNNKAVELFGEFACLNIIPQNKEA